MLLVYPAKFFHDVVSQKLLSEISGLPKDIRRVCR